MCIRDSVTPVPAVSVATAGPDVPPISSSPFASIATAANVSVPESCVIITDLSAKDVAPVPPLATVNVEDNPPAVPETLPVTLPVRFAVILEGSPIVTVSVALTATPTSLDVPLNVIVFPSLIVSDVEPSDIVKLFIFPTPVPVKKALLVCFFNALAVLS